MTLPLTDRTHRIPVDNFSPDDQQFGAPAEPAQYVPSRAARPARFAARFVGGRVVVIQIALLDVRRDRLDETKPRLQFAPAHGFFRRMSSVRTFQCRPAIGSGSPLTPPCPSVDVAVSADKLGGHECRFRGQEVCCGNAP